MLDFGGGATAPNGISGDRQALIRYTKPLGRWTVSAAAENPADVARPAAGGAGEIAGIGGLAPSTTTSMPDLTAKLEYAADWGHGQVAGLLRRVESDNGLGGSGPGAGTRLRDSALGYGVNAGGTLRIGRWIGGAFAADTIGG